jgi:hypothetical protein
VKTVVGQGTLGAKTSNPDSDLQSLVMGVVGYVPDGKDVSGQC